MKLWKPDAVDPNPDSSAWLGPLRLLSAFPLLRHVSPHLLRKIVRRTASNKAPGADGWAYMELKDWLLGMFELLAQVLALVEESGR